MYVNNEVRDDMYVHHEEGDDDKDNANVDATDTDLHRHLDENSTRVVCRLLLLPLLLLLILLLVVDHLLISIQVQMRFFEHCQNQRNNGPMLHILPNIGKDKKEDLISARQVSCVERSARSLHNVERSSHRHLTSDIMYV